jgi:hypothetical protein
MNASGSELQSGLDVRIGRHLPEIYLGVALVLVSALCLLTPPFFVPDEITHCAREMQIGHGRLIGELSPQGEGGWVDANAIEKFHRALEIQIGHGGFVGELPSRGVGGWIDANFNQVWEGIIATQSELWRRYPNTFKRPDGRVTEAQLAPFRQIRWAHTTVFVAFQNTAVYPPLLYLPQAAGWRIGEATGLTILRSMLLARWLAALSAVAIGWLALRLCPGERWLLCAYLLLPTNLALNGSCSQDGLLLPTAGLAMALLARVLHARRHFTLVELVAVTGLLAVCITARPPYIPLALLLFLPALALRDASWREFLPAGVGFVVIAGLLGAWEILIRPLGAYPHAISIPELQIAFLRAHPLHGMGIVLLGTLVYPPLVLATGLAAMGILDVYPPLWVYALLGVGLVGIAFFTPRNGSNARRVIATLLFILVAGFAAVTLAIYCICNPPGADWIRGLQARYYLPLVPFIFLLRRRPAAGGEEADRQPPAMGFLARWRGMLLVLAGGVFLAGVLYTPWEAAHGFYNLGLISAFHTAALW